MLEDKQSASIYDMKICTSMYLSILMSKRLIWNFKDKHEKVYGKLGLFVNCQGPWCNESFREGL